MGYKVGDEVMVKARIIEDCIGICGLKTQEGIVFNAKKENLLPIPDMTAEEAWEIARKIVLLEGEGGIPSKDMVHMFGVKFTREIIKKYSEHEVKAKIDAWKSENDIEVGDVITPKEGHYRAGEYGLVVCINSVGQIGVNYPGNDYVLYEKYNVKKTGRHIDIEGLLKQIGGNE